MFSDYWKKYFKEYVDNLKYGYKLNKNFTILRNWEDELKTDVHHTYEESLKYDKEFFYHPFRDKEDGNQTECDV